MVVIDNYWLYVSKICIPKFGTWTVNTFLKYLHFTVGWQLETSTPGQVYFSITCVYSVLIVCLIASKLLQTS